MATASATVKVDGLSTFKSNINQAKSALKSYDAELKLAEAQYKATGDAQEYERKKAELLNKEIAEQEKIVEESRKALESMEKAGKSNTSAYATMRTQMINAQTALVGMRTQVQGSKGDFTAQTEEVKKNANELEKYGGTLSNIGAKMGLDSITSGINTITNGLIGAVKLAAQLGKSLWDAEVDATVWADEVLTESGKYDIDAETYQQYEYAARFVDTSVDALMNARNRLVGQADNGVVNLFPNTDDDRFKISLKDAKGEARSFTDVLWDTIDALNKLYNDPETKMDAEQISFDLFGKSFSNMTPLISQGREAWEAYMADAPILSNEAVASLGAANDKFEELTATADTTQRQILAGLAGSFETIAGSLTSVLEAVNEWAQSEEGQAAIEAFGNAVVNVVNAFVGEDGQNLKDLVSGATSALNDFSDWLSKFDADDAIAGVKAFVAVLVSLKAVLFALKLANGAKLLSDLFSAGASGATAAGAASGASGVASGASNLSLGGGSLIIDGVATIAITAATAQIAVSAIRKYSEPISKGLTNAWEWFTGVLDGLTGTESPANPITTEVMQQELEGRLANTTLDPTSPDNFLNQYITSLMNREFGGVTEYQNFRGSYLSPELFKEAVKEALEEEANIEGSVAQKILELESTYDENWDRKQRKEYNDQMEALLENFYVSAELAPAKDEDIIVTTDDKARTAEIGETLTETIAEGMASDEALSSIEAATAEIMSAYLRGMGLSGNQVNNNGNTFNFNGITINDQATGDAFIDKINFGNRENRKGVGN